MTNPMTDPATHPDPREAARVLVSGVHAEHQFSMSEGLTWTCSCAPETPILAEQKQAHLDAVLTNRITELIDLRCDIELSSARTRIHDLGTQLIALENQKVEALVDKAAADRARGNAEYVSRIAHSERNQALAKVRDLEAENGRLMATENSETELALKGRIEALTEQLEQHAARARTAAETERSLRNRLADVEAEHGDLTEANADARRHIERLESLGREIASGQVTAFDKAELEAKIAELEEAFRIEKENADTLTQELNHANELRQQWEAALEEAKAAWTTLSEAHTIASSTCDDLLRQRLAMLNPEGALAVAYTDSNELVSTIIDGSAQVVRMLVDGDIESGRPFAVFHLVRFGGGR